MLNRDALRDSGMEDYRLTPHDAHETMLRKGAVGVHVPANAARSSRYVVPTTQKPHGAVYSKNGVWLDENDEPVREDLENAMI